MMYRRAAVVYNPAAGAKRGARVREAVEAVGRWAANVEVLETRGPGSATELARKACQAGADLVLACGGDGTVNEVVNGVAPGPTAVGVLPAGTANALAVEVGLPRDPVRAAQRLGEMEARRVALGRLRVAGAPPRYFVLACGAGLDARVLYETRASLKKRLGIAAYWVAGLSLLGRELEVVNVEVKGRRRECTMALFTRTGALGGGLRVCRRSHLLDVEMEALLFPSRSTVRYMLYMMAAQARRLEWCRDVERATVTSAQMDGERVWRRTGRTRGGCRRWSRSRRTR